MNRAEHGKSERHWDPELAGQKVRLRDSPGRQGVTTGRIKQAGSFLLVEVDFGPNEKQFKRYDLLEPVKAEEEMFDLLAAGKFGGPIDLRRVLTMEKVKGDLTNVFYSMEASNTEFYAHQFKPILKFIESPVGRLLVADEVGLGKTIESIYIWKELQAREGARRLLVVCPAMLREKWRSDLKTRFNIAAEIITARQLLERVGDFAERGLNSAFVYITSLEGIRPPTGFEDESTSSVRARIARMLDQNTASDALFDLVVIDEAHYLRNPSTASHRLGSLLREASKHMVLLTATPIQIDSDNLYQLLRLTDPDQFYDSQLFGEMLRANAPVVRALRCVWGQPPDIASAGDALESALSSIYFEDDAVLKRISAQLPSVGTDTEKRVELARLLESRSLLGQYMTRSRKREVLPHRIERAAQVLNVRFTDMERAIYNRVTERIRGQSAGKSGVSLFALIARQRQMASCLVAALQSWREKGLLEELLWEDLGRSVTLDQEKLASGGPELLSLEDVLGDTGQASDLFLPENRIDLAQLEAVDGKYDALRGFLREQLAKDPSEKFVVFAFFRGTLSYLQRRLRDDGIRTGLIMGAMGDAKNEVIADFARTDGPSVLLSSEVGSEGIDLQFCRFVVNYDLPWNPMRVEQRIGRIDRLGQKAERISIINLSLVDTIEDRILLRLYDRIDLFRDSIGDLEEILGEMTEQLMLDLLDPKLSDEERDRRAEAAELAIINRRADQKRLEEEAVNLVGFSDYLLSTINESRTRGRWLSAEELISLVDDFFARRYPGTKIEVLSDPGRAARIRLSDEARTALGAFIGSTKPATRTRLHQSAAPVLCHFDPRQTGTFGRDVELIEPTHPLVQWIRAEYGQGAGQLHSVSATRVAHDEVRVARGTYVFVAHRWSFVGLRSDHILAFSAIPLGAQTALDETVSERLVTAAARHGVLQPNAATLIGNLENVMESALICEMALGEAFGARMQDFEAENELRCNQQETSAKRFAERRIGELRERLERFRAQANMRPIPMTQGLLRKEEDQLRTKLAIIDQRRVVDPTMVQLAAGVIRVD